MSLRDNILRLWKVKDLRYRIGFVLFVFVIFRITAHIPVPGISTEHLKEFFASNEILGLLNIFSGGALANFSLVMLGLSPYITSSIIFQLLTMIIPSLEEMQKDGGEQGRQKINQYTRILAVPLSALQAYGTITLLQRGGGALAKNAAGASAQLIGDLNIMQWIVAIGTITAGSIFLMWLGELISEKGIGNGISLLIFAGIVTNFPRALQQTAAVFTSADILSYVLYAAIGLVTILSVVFITEGQRNIPVSYARQTLGGRSGGGGVNTFLPLRVNQAGVIPIIFAVSLVLIPSTVAQFFVGSGTPWLANAATFIVEVFNNRLYYATLYFILVVAFTYFYTAVIFHPDQISENLQKRGGFIPGIRPGAPTTHFLMVVSNRILLTGALFLGMIAILPYIVRAATNIQTFAVGGTSLLIVVSVVIETVKQIESQLVMRDYEGF